MKDTTDAIFDVVRRDYPEDQHPRLARKMFVSLMAATTDADCLYDTTICWNAAMQDDEFFLGSDRLFADIEALLTERFPDPARIAAILAYWRGVLPNLLDRDEAEFLAELDEYDHPAWGGLMEPDRRERLLARWRQHHATKTDA